MKSILWCQNLVNMPVEHLIPANLGTRVHATRVISRESLLELTFCTHPDLLIYEVSIPGDKDWSQVINFVRSHLPKMGLISIINEPNPESIKEQAKCKVDALIKVDTLHLELPHAIRAFQRSEVFLNPQIAKIICSFLQENSPANGFQDKGLLASLTNREMEVLACLTQGMNYRSIAKFLFVSDSTVKTHVNNIFTKLNVNDRTQAVLYGLRHGIDGMVPNIFNRIQTNEHQRTKVEAPAVSERKFSSELIY